MTYFCGKSQHVSLIDSRTKDWKTVRKALSPTFTSGKIKSKIKFKLSFLFF